MVNLTMKMKEIMEMMDQVLVLEMDQDPVMKLVIPKN
jgi:hypothetical protein